MTRNWRIIGAWLVRVLFSFPKWWNYEYKDFRLIFEQDGQLRYFTMPSGFQRAVARLAIVAFSMALFSLAGLGAISYLLNAETERLETSKQAIYATLLGDSKIDASSFTEAELLNLVQEVKDRQQAIQQYLGFSAIAFKEENQSLTNQLQDTGLTEKAIQAIEHASMGGRQAEAENYSSPQNLLPDSLVGDILKNRDLHDILRALPEQMPLKQFEISSEFGIRQHPISGVIHFHTGVDLVVIGSDDKIYPAKAGRVISASMHPQLGNTVVIQHSHGIQTLYAHLEDIDIQIGDTVQLDKTIGTVGNTGASSTGPHLHFEVLVGGFSANPIKVIRAARNVQQIY